MCLCVCHFFTFPIWTSSHTSSTDAQKDPFSAFLLFSPCPPAKFLFSLSLVAPLNLSHSEGFSPPFVRVHADAIGLPWKIIILFSFFFYTQATRYSLVILFNRYLLPLLSFRGPFPPWTRAKGARARARAKVTPSTTPISAFLPSVFWENRRPLVVPLPLSTRDSEGPSSLRFLFARRKEKVSRDISFPRRITNVSSPASPSLRLCVLSLF